MHRVQVGDDGAGEVAAALQPVVEREMDDPIGLPCGGAQVVEIREIPPPGFSAQCLHGCCRAVRAGEPRHGVTGGEQFGDERGGDVPRRPGDENAHGGISFSASPQWRVP